ncbi:HAD family hydrolase [Saccharothrix variisporea]|uniref:HAD family hydrolase n=1 Tax=Saccharothrix variisporea TaxID=543527 RepID=UPI000EB2F54C
MVSKNSVAAVDAYLHQNGLYEKVDFVAARSTSSPSNLKSSRFLLDQAVLELGVDSRNCTIIGDTATDIVARKIAGCKTIGYVNRATQAASP